MNCLDKEVCVFVEYSNTINELQLKSTMHSCFDLGGSREETRLRPKKPANRTTPIVYQTSYENGYSMVVTLHVSTAVLILLHHHT